MEITDEGITIFCNDEHLEKVSFAIEVIELGKIISVNELQYWNAFFPIYVTDGGIIIFINSEHPANEESSIDVIEYIKK